jgi:hypothetical protein
MASDLGYTEVCCQTSPLHVPDATAQKHHDLLSGPAADRLRCWSTGRPAGGAELGRRSASRTVMRRRNASCIGTRSSNSWRCRAYGSALTANPSRCRTSKIINRAGGPPIAGPWRGPAHVPTRVCAVRPMGRCAAHSGTHSRATARETTSGRSCRLRARRRRSRRDARTNMAIHRHPPPVGRPASASIGRGLELWHLTATPRRGPQSWRRDRQARRAAGSSGVSDGGSASAGRKSAATRPMTAKTARLAIARM